ncbi:hypothetical protein ALC60_04853 [Trachymyrmex zeteki]|uniref:ZP domain-containing protein n=1 Tax=Mycetomoellerius zeteki TaxID=64791 RepID=A0A151X7C8_9HYME|nr:hypothetical protein ALC60_04853 [Trachymyrmex zeteki]
MLPGDGAVPQYLAQPPRPVILMVTPSSLLRRNGSRPRRYSYVVPTTLSARLIDSLIERLSRATLKLPRERNRNYPARRRQPSREGGARHQPVTLRTLRVGFPALRMHAVILRTRERSPISGDNHTEERSIPIAVRIHKTLELADDKFYVITCGKAGFKNAKNETSLVSLRLLDEGVRVQEAIYGHNYTLRAEISRPDGTYGIRVKNCFAFNKLNSSVQLIDDKGCPVKVRMTKFIYDRSTGIADATLFSMFRFADSSEVHFQCDIAVCRGSCGTPVCEGDKEELIKGGSSTNGQSVSSEEGVLLAGTSVFVLQPGEKRVVQTLHDDGSVHPLWLLWLAVALGILFLIMLIINIFLCSAMTCSCTRTDIIEKEPSIIEDYDPYRSWHGSQYGSRYSLNGKQGYASGGSTMNSTRSISTNSDHYAIVHSRPGSRYSGPGQKHHHHHRGPPSNIGSHYSGK